MHKKHDEFDAAELILAVIILVAISYKYQESIIKIATYTLYTLAVIIILLIMTYLIYRRIKKARLNKLEQERAKQRGQEKKLQKQKLAKEAERRRESEKQEFKNAEQIKPKRKNVAARALAKQRSVRIKVDPDKRFFRQRDLSLDDLKYLLAKGYKEIRCMNINGRRERYLIKPRSNESVEHFFLTFNIANYLKTITKQITLYETLKPDIVFELKGKKYAIEIETGTLYLKNKPQLSEKVNKLKEEYGERYCFVITNYRFGSAYRQFGKTFTRKNFIQQFQKWLKKH